MYVADQNNGILKYYFDGTNWNYVGDKLDYAGGVTGITGYRAGQWQHCPVWHREQELSGGHSK